MPKTARSYGGPQMWHRFVQADDSTIYRTNVNTSIGYDLFEEIETTIPATMVRPRRRSGLGAVVASVYLSANSILGGEHRPKLWPDDGSVFLGQVARKRRKITLAEAREIALEAVRLENARFAVAAQHEAYDFEQLFNWEPE